MDQTSLKKLQKKWYSKLKSKGFRDIEASEQHLCQWDSHYFRERYSPVEFSSRQRYFELAAQLVHEPVWRKPWHKRAWEHHVTGLTLVAIGKKVRRPTTTVYDVIRYYARYIKA